MDGTRKQILLGIDLGTTRLKVAAFSPDGTLQHQAGQRHRERRLGERRWQDADCWWQVTVDLCRRVLAALGEVEVLGISLSGRGGAAVFADAAGNVLVQPWSDGRHQADQRTVRAEVGDRLSPYGLAMVAKLRWLAREVPGLRARTRQAFYGKDFLLHHLTGRHATDWSSGPDGPNWDVGLLEDLGIGSGLLPEPMLPWELAGTLTPAASRQLGLPAGVPVAVGAHDGVCANIGAGATQPGDYALTLGTHAVLRTVVAECPPGANRFYVMPPAGHVVGGNALMGGRAADWFVDLLRGGRAERSRQEDLAVLDALAADVPAGARGVRFLPYLAGQVAPERRPGARAGFFGLNMDHGRAAAFRALLEGVAFAIAHIEEQVAGWGGEPRRLRLTGSGARSAVWTRILAAVLQRSLEVSDGAVESRGAAICLAVALGLHADVQQAGEVMVPIVRTEAPDDALAAAYVDVRRDWEALDQLLRMRDAAP
ncbi:MAG: FGGY family carbohydrate kinase [Pseudomonadales bacterium]